jgi:hypothetical protein
MTKNWKKFTTGNFAIYLSLGLHKERAQATGEALGKEHPALQT